MAKRTKTRTRTAGRALRAPRKRGSAKARGTDDASEREEDEEGSGPGRNTFGRYLRDLSGASPLLTPDEEIDLGRRIVERAIAITMERLAFAERILKTGRPRKLFRPYVPAAADFVKKFNPRGLKGKRLKKRLLGLYFKRNDECPQRAVMIRYVSDDREGAALIDRFVRANLRLVINVAKRYNRGGMPFPDLVQEGNLGLLHAVPRFDYRRGFRFSTFASWWIRHALSRAIADKARTVRIPVHMTEAFYALDKARSALVAELGRTPTLDELSKKTCTPIDKLDKMRVWTLAPTSLDQPVGRDEGEEPLGSFIAEEPEEAPGPWATLIPGMHVEMLRNALASLEGIDGDVIRKRFGLDGGEEMTLKEIGDRYNLSRERIRQLEKRGLAMLRKKLPRSFAAAIR